MFLTCFMTSLRALTSGFARSSARPTIRRTRLDLEILEDRSVPAKFTMSAGIAVEYAMTAKETDSSSQSVQRDLGAPTSSTMKVPGMGNAARMNTFQNGVIYWSPSTGAHVVYGAIDAEYNNVGGPAVYGLPTRDEANVHGVSGERVTDFQDGRAIYWSYATGAHLVYGAIEAKYAALANEKSAAGTPVNEVLGAPTSNEMYVPGMGDIPGDPRMNTFQNGAIYWSPSTGAHVVYGAIGAEYNALGGPTNFLGLPTSDETAVAGKPGLRVTHFQHGAIYWSVQTGAYVVLS